MTLTQILDRLGTGERWWSAHIIIRAAGLLLLGMAAWAVSWLYRSVHVPSRHEASGGELLAALVVVVGGCGGATLTFLGPSLFERVPIPRGGAALRLWAEGDRDDSQNGFPAMGPAAAGPATQIDPRRRIPQTLDRRQSQ